MTRATRVGLKVFDPLEIIEGNRIRRDLLLADKFAFDEAQLEEARGYAEVVCAAHEQRPDQGPAKIRRRLGAPRESWDFSSACRCATRNRRWKCKAKSTGWNKSRHDVWRRSSS